ncbi:hypothetical protein F4553_002778 [Allocatelliglobosispora scoriae]|uniref:Recombinase A n=1 Tax=Allocatelliglobosispora scoriae TaxID=643052 RepID=A0A841BQE4_9ACTN|nr:hypothetical protein [Allocatelliglobosispora scoriae]MBB5869399.1 hypothetical protein [Allocatelliglobosispora scoriae]
MRPAIEGLVRRASDLAPDMVGQGSDRLLPVRPELRDLLPEHGLRRGTTIAITGDEPGATSLLLALLAEASRTGSWCAVVGLPGLGLVAAAESGIALDRLAVVPRPGPEWATVVAALLDGFDVVVTAVTRVTATVAGQLAARARQRGSVLVPFGAGWDGSEITLSTAEHRWHGVGETATRRMTVAARGRGSAARPRRTQFWLPGPAVPESAPPRLRSIH